MTHGTRRFVLAAAFSAAALTATVMAGTKFTTTWKAPGAEGGALAGQKVAVVAITEDQSLRMATEEAMARALTAKGVAGEASYRIIPIQELKDKQKAQAWFERRGVRAVVALRLISVDTSRSYSPTVWVTSSYYGSFYDYAAWGLGDPANWNVTESTTVALEMLVFAIHKGGALVWAGTCETDDPPKSADKFAKSVVGEAVKQMEKSKLLVKR
jgi:hypothetical protein